MPYDSNLTPERLAMILAAAGVQCGDTGISLEIPTTIPKAGPNFIRHHTYSERDYPRKDLDIDPAANKSEWKGHAR